MKLYAVIPTNEAAMEQALPGEIPALFLDKAEAEAYSDELTGDGEEYGVEELEITK